MTRARRSRLGITFTFALLPFLAVAQTSVRTNVGGPGYTDSNGAVWQSDTGCTGASTFARGSAISGTADSTLYVTGREGNNFSCTYTVSAVAFYYVTVRFAETLPSISTSNPRIFNVFINNTFQRTINIIGTGTPRNTASDYAFGPFAVYGTSITIGFNTVANPAFINAIDIEATGNFGSSTFSQILVHPNSTSNPAAITQYGYGLDGIYCTELNDGIRYKNNDGSQELGGVDCFAEPYVRSGVDHKSKVAMVGGDGTGTPGGEAPGLDLSSDSGVKFGNGDELIAPNTYDTALFRDDIGIAKITSGLNDTNYRGLHLQFIKLNPAGIARPTCAVAIRGRVWQTYGAPSAADTVAVCAKDSSDVYAWRTIY